MQFYKAEKWQFMDMLECSEVNKLDYFYLVRKIKV